MFKASRGIEDIYELTYVRKDGSRFPAVVSVTALRDAQGTIIGYLLIGTDNTARQQVEDALRESEARFRALVTASSDAVYRMSADWSEMRSTRWPRNLHRGHGKRSSQLTWFRE